jgi:anti-sigma B factor antagonist
VTVEIKTEPLSDRAFAVAIAGEVDLYVAPELKQKLLDVIDRGATQVVVDLTDATFIDSTTLGVLIGAVRRLRANDGKLSVVVSDRNVARTFELSGLDRVFEIFPTREQAVARLDGGLKATAQR